MAESFPRWSAVARRDGVGRAELLRFVSFHLWPLREWRVMEFVYVFIYLDVTFVALMLCWFACPLFLPNYATHTLFALLPSLTSTFHLLFTAQTLFIYSSPNHLLFTFSTHLIYSSPDFTSHTLNQIYSHLHHLLSISFTSHSLLNVIQSQSSTFHLLNPYYLLFTCCYIPCSIKFIPILIIYFSPPLLLIVFLI